MLRRSDSRCSGGANLLISSCNPSLLTSLILAAAAAAQQADGSGLRDEFLARRSLSVSAHLETDRNSVSVSVTAPKTTI